LTEYDGNTFAYDARGRRITKNGITFIYDSNGNLIKQSNGLEFLYDHTGVFAVKYADLTYFYRKNAQNDIVALLDNSGAVVVKYKYDAWGNCVIDAGTTNNNLANLNPFRYRSYYFDTETGFYFLKTRYYDPEIGRFMTIDDIGYLDPESINGLNLYIYCLNNPTINVDPSGRAGLSVFATALIFAIVIGALTVGVIAAINAYQTGVTGAGLVGTFLAGSIMGAAMGAITTIGGAAGLTAVGLGVAGYTLTSFSAALGISVAIGTMAGMASYSVEHWLREDKSISATGLIMSGLSGALKGLTTFTLAYFGGKFGAFDNLFWKPTLDGAELFTKSIATALLADLFPSVGRTIFAKFSLPLGIFLAKMLLLNSSTAFTRWLIDRIFDPLIDLEG
jgi:RHS repeat-associated protein